MKKTILLIGLVLLGLTVKSQVLISIILGDKLNSPNLEFGLEGGYNWSSISGFESASPLSTFNLGFYFDIRVKKNFYINTGVLVKSNLGIGKLTNTDLYALGASTFVDTLGGQVEGAYSQRLNYFLIPVLAKYRHKSNIYVELGPQFGIMYNGWVQFVSDIDGLDATVKEYNSDQINRIDIGGVIGAGYKFKKGPGWSVGVKYYTGFVDVYKNIANTKNSALFVKANIPIGAGEKSKK